jgi:hypothetical protein
MKMAADSGCGPTSRIETLTRIALQECHGFIILTKNQETKPKKEREQTVV